jgi:branched-chain amino acid transport system ATP-binding protein
MPLLELSKVAKYFGKLQAVADLDLKVEAGEVRSLIGPNGAGKTMVFNLITGSLPLTSGSIIFNGEDITRLEPHLVT